MIALMPDWGHRLCKVVRNLKPNTYRKICAVALFLLVSIVVTGGAVRLTSSGLGCPDWPTCEYDQFSPESGIHGWVEFINRLITGLVSVIVMLAVLGSLFRTPRRNDLIKWSLGLVGGLVGQIVLGGIVVLSHLNPWLVLGHFALSMVLVWNAVVLHHKASDPKDSPTEKFFLKFTTVLTSWALVMLASGMLVTGSGPHTGSRDDPIERLPFAIREIVRVHSSSVIIFLVLATIFSFYVFKNSKANSLRSITTVLCVVTLGQAIVGWVQYFTGVPELLVGLHIAGATALWATLVKSWLIAHGSQ